MTGSARRSDRVKRPTGPGTEFAGLWRRKAPESIAPSVATPARVAERRGRLSPKQVTAIQRELSDRDVEIVKAINDYGFLTTAHLTALFFSSAATAETAARLCRRSLRRLADRQLIAVLDRRVGGIRAGSAATIWRLDRAGDWLLRRREGAARTRFKEPSPRFLDHRLAVADCALALMTAAHENLIELLTCVPEPASWRRFLGPHGSFEILKPDLAVVTASADYEDSWVCEIDRATESLPTVIRKCEQYERYRATGREQQAGGVFPIVVWVVPDQARASRIQLAIDTSRSLDALLYRVVTMAGFRDLILRGAA